MSELFGGIYARGAAALEVGDPAWLQAMLDVEAALARALGKPELAKRIAASQLDPLELGRAATDSVSPVVPLVDALRETAGADAHEGATSQDILDTAMMLVARRALEPLIADAAAAAEEARALAEAHRETPIMGRTLLQTAEPTSFGLKAAGWMLALDDATEWLWGIRERALAVQMGGPVGHRDPAVARAVAEELDLAEPSLPWHTNRLRPALLGAGLGAIAGTAAKIARDVTLLASEGEVRDARPGRGRSSSMAHKRNPAAAIAVLACARRVPPLVATMFGSMEQEHERAAGAWQAEWGTVSNLLSLSGSATAWVRDLLENLEIDSERMVEGAGSDPDLGFASELVDRALAARRE